MLPTRVDCWIFTSVECMTTLISRCPSNICAPIQVNAIYFAPELNSTKSKCLLEKLTLVQFHYLIIIACDFEHDIFHFLLSDIESKITYSFTHYFQLGPKCVVDLQKIKNKMISINIIFAFSKIWPGQKFGIFERVVPKLSSSLESVQLLF